MLIRPEAEGEEAAIRQVTEAAFAVAEHRSGTEAAIVEGLRAAGRLTLSLVAVAGGEVIGHVAFSPVTVGGEEVGWFGLGPLSVRPERQGEGVGSALVREGLARLRRAGAAGCVVLGDPGYYRRFGFEADPALTFAGVPAAYFMRLVIAGAAPAGAVVYQPAFYQA